MHRAMQVHFAVIKLRGFKLKPQLLARLVNIHVQASGFVCSTFVGRLLKAFHSSPTALLLFYSGNQVFFLSFFFFFCLSWSSREKWCDWQQTWPLWRDQPDLISLHTSCRSADSGVHLLGSAHGATSHLWPWAGNGSGCDCGLAVTITALIGAALLHPHT